MVTDLSCHLTHNSRGAWHTYYSFSNNVILCVNKFYIRYLNLCFRLEVPTRGYTDTAVNEIVEFPALSVDPRVRISRTAWGTYH